MNKIKIIFKDNTVIKIKGKIEKVKGIKNNSEFVIKDKNGDIKRKLEFEKGIDYDNKELTKNNMKQVSFPSLIDSKENKKVKKVISNDNVFYNQENLK
ncbi:MAG: hypothetical protein ACOCP8_07365 [archaeon]